MIEQVDSPLTGSVDIHQAHCDIWATPEMSSPDALIAAGYEDESIATYLASVSPLYAAFSRILAQYSGILLLAMTDSRNVMGLDRRMWQSAQDQLAEATARLQSVEPPMDARRHWQALNSISIELKLTALKMDHASTSEPGKRKDNLQTSISKLRFVQKLLLATAEPDANITPLDFESACCTCGALTPKK